MALPYAPTIKVAAVWMAAAAYTVGYGPDEARPLGHAYAWAKYRGRTPIGPLSFAGMQFRPAANGDVLVGRVLFTAGGYVRNVAQPLGAWAPTLLLEANELLEKENVEQLDQTDLAWRMFEATLRRARGAETVDCSVMVAEVVG